jgi:protein-tyrosine phosphatase
MAAGPASFTDLHSHLVPGVDDGARDLEDARVGLQKMERSGVRTIVTTPHLDGSLTRDLSLLAARLEEVDEAWGSLKAMGLSEFPGLNLYRGHEVMLDVPDPDLSDPRLRLAETDFVLVEWQGLRVPPSTLPVLARIVSTGIRPIIAHPERYRGMDSGMRLAGEWKEAGALLQVNHGSLLGRYGDAPRKNAITILERGWAHLLASDFHGRPHLEPFLVEARDLLYEWEGGSQFELLARLNPSRILEGGDPLPVPPLEVRPGIWGRLRGAFQQRNRG